MYFRDLPAHWAIEKLVLSPNDEVIEVVFAEPFAGNATAHWPKVGADPDEALARQATETIQGGGVSDAFRAVLADRIDEAARQANAHLYERDLVYQLRQALVPLTTRPIPKRAADQEAEESSIRELVELFNARIDQSTRRIRCDSVIVRGDRNESAIGPVVGYMLGARAFTLAGEPFPDDASLYALIAVETDEPVATGSTESSD